MTQKVPKKVSFFSFSNKKIFDFGPFSLNNR